MKMFSFLMICLLFILNLQINLINSFALPGKIDFKLNKSNNYYAVTSRGLYNQTKVQIKMRCTTDVKFKVGWLLRESSCIDEFLNQPVSKEIFPMIYRDIVVNMMDHADYVYYIKSDLETKSCTDSFIELFPPPGLTPQKKIIKKPSTLAKLTTNSVETSKDQKEVTKTAPIIINTANSTNLTDQNAARKRRAAVENKKSQPEQRQAGDLHHEHHSGDFDTLATTWSDGAYLFILYTEAVDAGDYELETTVAFQYRYGYLSGNDWPFLPFYAVMCAIYIIYAIVWFTCSCCYFKDVIRIQFWIGGVILLGMIEKAAYLAEYESVQRNGYTVEWGLICAEFISCLKRSLARMLVIIVSLGFGIVKPRLGPTLQKVVAVGVLYFVLAAIDSVFRVTARKEDTDNKGILASIPLAILDVSICYWILTNLQQTMRTLRVRRNIPKLSLYRHFTNTLIFCVIASVIFMIWSLKRHRFITCLKDWKELWLDDAFWHILFSFILLVIIILWRPSNNSQRFQFSPLMDNDDEEGLIQDENQENEVFDSIKMRTKVNDANKPKPKEKTIEDELKWVEEHVPTSVAENALPAIIDSDEEVMTTRFEISKMD